MAEMGRLQPFVAVTQSDAFAVPAKGSLRPISVVRWNYSQWPLTDQKAAVRIALCRRLVLTRRQHSCRGFASALTGLALGLPDTIYVIQHSPDAGWNDVGIGDDREQSRP